MGEEVEALMSIEKHVGKSVVIIKAFFALNSQPLQFLALWKRVAMSSSIVFMKGPDGSLKALSLTSGCIIDVANLGDMDVSDNIPALRSQVGKMTMTNIKDTCSALGFRVRGSGGKDKLVEAFVANWSRIRANATVLATRASSSASAPAPEVESAGGVQPFQGEGHKLDGGYGDTSVPVSSANALADPYANSLTNLTGNSEIDGLIEKGRTMGINIHVVKRPETLFQSIKPITEEPTEDAREDGDFVIEDYEPDSEGEMSIFDFFPLSEEYLKDPSCFDGVSNVLVVTFKQCKGQMIFRLGITDFGMTVLQLKEKFVEKADELSMQKYGDTTTLGIYDFSLRLHGAQMEDNGVLLDYMDKDDQRGMEVFVTLRLKGGAKSIVKKETKQDKLKNKVEIAQQKLNQLVNSVSIDARSIGEVQSAEAKVNDFMAKVNSLGAHPALLHLAQELLKNNPADFDEVLTYLKTTKSGNAESKIRMVAVKMIGAGNIEKLIADFGAVSEVRPSKTTVAMGFDFAVAQSEKFSFGDFVSMIELVKQMSATGQSQIDVGM